MKHPLFWGLVMPAVLRRVLPRALLDSPVVVVARHSWLALGVAGIALAIGGLAFAASGVMPLKASAGHWPITRWFLDSRWSSR